MQDEIDFGGVTLGGRGAVDIAIRSESRVPTVLLLDLSKYPEFSLNLPAEWSAMGNENAPITKVSIEEAAKAGMIPFYLNRKPPGSYLFKYTVPF